MRERARQEERKEAGEDELLAHLEELPPARGRLVVDVQEADGIGDGAVPMAQQQGVQEGDAEAVEQDGEARRRHDLATRPRPSAERAELVEVVAQEADGRRPVHVLEAVARGQGAKAARRDRREDEEGPVEYERQRRDGRLAAQLDDNKRGAHDGEWRERGKEQLAQQRGHAEADGAQPRQPCEEVQVGDAEGVEQPLVRGRVGEVVHVGELRHDLVEADARLDLGAQREAAREQHGFAPARPVARAVERQQQREPKDDEHNGEGHGGAAGRAALSRRVAFSVLADGAVRPTQARGARGVGAGVVVGGRSGAVAARGAMAALGDGGVVAWAPEAGLERERAQRRVEAARVQPLGLWVAGARRCVVALIADALRRSFGGGRLVEAADDARVPRLDSALGTEDAFRLTGGARGRVEAAPWAGLGCQRRRLVAVVADGTGAAAERRALDCSARAVGVEARLARRRHVADDGALGQGREVGVPEEGGIARLHRTCHWSRASEWVWALLRAAQEDAV